MGIIPPGAPVPGLEPVVPDSELPEPKPETPEFEFPKIPSAKQNPEPSFSIGPGMSSSPSPVHYKRELAWQQVAEQHRNARILVRWLHL